MIDTIELPWRFGTIEVPAGDRYIRKSIEVTGEYSGAETDLYQALLHPGDVALDVGANIGVFSIAMGLAVGAAGRVLAFEPQPPMAAILTRNLAAHELSNAEVRREIVAERVGVGEFVDIRAVPAGRSVNFGGMGVGARIISEFGGVAETPVTSVDALNLQRCALIKVDVEGAEHTVLAGAEETIARCRPILSVECDRPSDSYPWVDGLLRAGYRLWRFRGSIMRSPNPKGASVASHPVLSVLMALAVPEERLERLKSADRSSLQPVDSRAMLERLSRSIVVDGAPGG